MNVLFLTPRYPFPADRGDRLLAYRTIEILATQHRVTLLSLVEGTEPPASLDALRRLGVEVHTVLLPPWRSWLQTAAALIHGAPLQVAHYRSSKLEARLRELAAQTRFDVAFAHCARMGPAVLSAPASRRIGLLTDSIGLSLHRRARHENPLVRPLVLLEARRMEAYERALAERLDESWVVSEVDRAHFPEAVRGRIRVVPNGFPQSFLELDRSGVVRGRVLFVGHLSVPHNVDAARRLVGAILPLVRERRGDATVRLVGAGGDERVRALAAHPGVEFRGYAEDLGAEYAAADVFVAPLRFAAGMQNKLIEAMAAGVPCVTSALAAEGISAEPGEHLLVAADDDAFATATTRLLDDPDFARGLGARGRAFVRSHFDWNRVLTTLAAGPVR